MDSIEFGPARMQRLAWAAANAVQFGFTLAWTAGLITIALLLWAVTGGLKPDAPCWRAGCNTRAALWG